ncbi:MULTISPECIES: chemotaxis protein CheX [unclassified Cellulomonas]|uniref:chemotaxis protein CheX n=1 Tax=unclassified Cellulomonas TaxID=2620175 RepID=UPI0019BED5AC|nr:chemotaxis protein CheX [Cellulomonas sp. ES6]MBD3780865.1 chemotaxis protein CheX [Micrococcales bacterium]WHP19000.1 chemotaxis protein CheX [Cellulomonas sp. ES6]
MTAAVEHDQVYAIAEEVFAAMIDGEPGYLRPWEGDVPVPAEPLVAWVDVHGELAGRAAVTTDVPTAHELTRALLGMDAGEPVGPEDLVDAFGEVANVVGGNVKALLPSQGTLSLPQVAAELPVVPGTSLTHELRLDWRGRPVVVVVWLFP